MSTWHDPVDERHVLILDPDTTARLFTLDLAIEAVETAYRAHASGAATRFPLVTLPLAAGATVSVKGGYWPARGVVGLKQGGFWPDNPRYGRERHQATVLLCDAVTGRLLALMNGNVITTRRTAASGALGIRVLARSDAQVAAILGTGVQAAAQADALMHERPDVREIHVWGRDAWHCMALVSRLRARSINAKAMPFAEMALDGADIVITTTPSSLPLFDATAIGSGAHINAMGADAPGKRELPPDLVAAATFVVDDREQSRTIGEGKSPVHLSAEPATLGEILLGTRAGRTRAGEITIFDSTGIGIQDVTSAVLLYQRARETGEGTWIGWDA